MKRFASTLAAVAAGSLVLLCLGCVWPYDVLLRLAVGWVFFLARVVPQVTVSAGGVATAAACLIALAVGLHCFLGWFASQARKDEGGPAWKWRWSLAALGVVVVMFVAGISASGVAHQTVWLVTSPEPLWTGGIGGVAGRMASANNLKQIGLSAHNFADEHGKHFPAGGTCDTHGTMLHGWQTALLPYIEQEALYRQIRQDVPWNDPANAPHFRKVIRIYLQPAARHQPNPAEFAPSHYAGNVRVLGGTTPWATDKITDGLANTILAGEAAGRYKPWGHPTNWRDPALGINRSPDGFGSPLPKGANMLFADGRVIFMSQDVHPDVLTALSTPNGGEEVKADY